MSNLHHAITTAAIAAGRDKTLPILNAVRVTPTHVWATDRYRLIRTAHNHENLIEVLVPLAIASQVKAKPIRALADGMLTFEDGSTLVWEPVNGDYPAVDRLLPDESDVKPVEGVVSFNPSFLADLAKIAKVRVREDRGLPVRMYGSNDGSPNKPVLFKFADHTEYLLVPVRFAS